MAQRRCMFSEEMDQTILKAVSKQDFQVQLQNGNTRILWSKISKKYFPKLSHRSVRQRYMRVLNPELKHEGFSQEEDKKLLKYVKKYGTSWSLILPHLPGRSGKFWFAFLKV